MTWVRHEQAPWYRKPAPAEYGFMLPDYTWVVLRRQRGTEKSAGLRWVAVWGMAGYHGIGPSIVCVLFQTRTLKAAQMLTELWAQEVRGV